MIYEIPAPTKNDGAVEIVDWSIKEVLFEEDEERTRHLIGFILEEEVGRVSSAIKNFDPDQMLIQTQSGRLYKLSGEPGKNLDADYVWNFWKKANKVRFELDVTDKYFSRSN